MWAFLRRQLEYNDVLNHCYIFCYFFELTMYKKLLSDSIIYGLGAIIVKSMAFFTLPIYTRIFSPEEFGVIEMFATLGGLISIIMTMGLDSAQSFYFMEAKHKGENDVRKITTSILQLRLVIGSIVVFLGTLLTSAILEASFSESTPDHYFWIILASTFFATLVSQSLEIFRLLYRPWMYIGLSLVQTLSGIGAILFFCYWDNAGVEGYLKGVLLGSLIAMCIGWLATRHYRYWTKIEYTLWKGFVKFGLPLIPAGFTVWVMQASDRFFIMKLLGSQEVGIYSVAAKFALIIMLAIETFRKAWWPIAMEMIHKDDGPDFFRNISFFYVLFSSIGIVGLSYISPYLITWLTTEDYSDAWRLVGTLSLGSVFYGFYLISGIGVFYSQKTYLSIIIYGSGALLNVLLNYIFIPIWGLYGAALATSIGLLLSNVVGMIVSNKFYPIKWRWISMACITAATYFFVQH